ncbi:MAG TPA: DUF2911 domain-containing protein [Longimicrobiales bacterium]|nr:DUF2911 domain-containing protein [Longimicrobiales bacterium]
MRRSSVLPVLAGLAATLAACGGGESAGSDTSGAADTAASAAAQAPAPASDGQLTCWMREGTPPAADRPSPLGETVLVFGGQEALLCYGRPSARGRTVMGDLVPYGAPWRLGANEATTLHVPFAVRVGGVALEPGSYSLYAIPGETEWQIVVNRAIERWGIPISDEVRAQDVGSFSAPVSSTEAPVETLTISWADRGEGAGDLVVEWENTRVVVPVERAR